MCNGNFFNGIIAGVLFKSSDLLMTLNARLAGAQIVFYGFPIKLGLRYAGESVNFDACQGPD